MLFIALTSFLNDFLFNKLRVIRLFKGLWDFVPIALINTSFCLLKDMVDAIIGIQHKVHSPVYHSYHSQLLQEFSSMLHCVVGLSITLVKALEITSIKCCFTFINFLFSESYF